MPAMPPGTTVALTARFAGRVQGVGFRFTVCGLAVGRAVNGWVRNAADGAVELRVEGARGEVEELLADVRASPVGPGIRSEQLSWSAPQGLPRGFHIRF